MREPHPIIAIIQARMNSRRLPGKVLLDIAGEPMLWWVVRRAMLATTLARVVVATSTAKEDDAIANMCSERGISCFRGDEIDVLDRYYKTACAVQARTIVRLTADCPLLDPGVIDDTVRAFLRQRCDYASNAHPSTFPDGLDVEVFSFEALEVAWRDACLPAHREHVTPYMRTSGIFHTANVSRKEGSFAGHRWTVDDPADLAWMRTVYDVGAATLEWSWCDRLYHMELLPELQRTADAPRNAGYYHTLAMSVEAKAAPPLARTQSEAWFDRAQEVIPGCAQTFSKGYTQHVRGVAPLFLQKGRGCYVWDVDGNEYIDYIQGLCANILGYAHAEVTEAVAATLYEGHSFSLPHPLEVELAERLVELIPCAEMVRFGKNGSDATAGAVRVARAFTKRDRIASCGYHGWQDWSIGSTTRHAGVPKAVRTLIHTFPYNDLTALEALFHAHPGKFAAVIMEPVTFVDSHPDYLRAVKDLTRKHGALLIFDEICTGFRFGVGGAQTKYGVTPDLACFGKALGNGFPISCVVGRADIMRRFDEVFFSFTAGGETASIAAALKVLDILEHTDALARIEANGCWLQDGVNALARETGVSDWIQCVGHPAWSLLKCTDDTGAESLLVRSLFQQEAVKRGLLVMTTHNMSTAHDGEAIERTLEVYAAVFATLAQWLRTPHPEQFLEGPMIQPVFRVRS